MMAPIVKVLGEGNCGRVTDRGKEACECVRKCRPVVAVRSHSHQSCEATNRNVIQGRSGQASGPNITKPFPDAPSGKWRACAAKHHVLIRGDLELGPESRLYAESQGHSVQTVRQFQKSAEAILLTVIHH